MDEYIVKVVGFAVMVLAIGFAAVALLAQVAGVVRDVTGALPW